MYLSIISYFIIIDFYLLFKSKLCTFRLISEKIYLILHLYNTTLYTSLKTFSLLLSHFILSTYYHMIHSHFIAHSVVTPQCIQQSPLNSSVTPSQFLGHTFPIPRSHPNKETGDVSQKPVTIFFIIIVLILYIYTELT